ncbi:MAG: histidine phosphatase family protein [Terrimicrobiaceae bacterium]
MANRTQAGYIASMLTLYLLRHGQTSFSRANAFCGAALNPDLTEDGHIMAECFAKAYAATPWQAIFTSPLKRTLETAHPLCNLTGQSPQVRDGLKEIGYGKWEGKTVEEVSQEYHDDYLAWTADPAWYPPTDGEAAVSIAHRSLQVVEEIQKVYEEGNVLIISHKATIRILMCSLLGIDVGRFRYRLACPVASVSVIEFGKHGPLLKSMADRSHLDDRLRNQPGT